MKRPGLRRDLLPAKIWTPAAAPVAAVAAPTSFAALCAFAALSAGRALTAAACLALATVARLPAAFATAARLAHNNDVGGVLVASARGAKVRFDIQIGNCDAAWHGSVERLLHS